jgi:hypothetical protein
MVGKLAQCVATGVLRKLLAIARTPVDFLS